MLRKIFSFFFVTVVLSGIVLGYSGGVGTESSPYLISSPSDIQELAATSSDWDKYFKQTQDINLEGYPNLKIGTDYSNYFSGQYDGDGNTISNYSYTISEDYAALFGYVAAGAVIENLDVTDAGVNAPTGKYAAVLVGKNYGTVSFCSVSGNVTADNYSAGLVGRNHGVIADCSSEVDVEADSRAGCLTSYNASGASISRSCAEGNVSGSDRVGGLVGENIGSVTNCYSSADVEGTDKVGGLLGSSATGSITDCYSYGTVSGRLYYGAFMGDRVSGAVSGCFFDNDASGLTSAVGRGASTGITGKTTVQMMDEATFNAAEWDMDIWTVVTGYDYPRFDNVGTAPPSLPNLTVAGNVATVDLVGFGLINVPFTVSNNGTQAAQTSFATSLYMANAPDVDWDSLDSGSKIGNDAILNNIAIAGSANGSISYNSLLAAGTYYLRVKTDSNSALAELNESDNWSDVIVFTVTTAPDLTINSNQPSYQTLPSAPVMLSVNVSNIGTAAVDGTTFKVSAYKSNSPVNDWDAYIASNSPIAFSTISSLAIGANVDKNIMFNAPNSPGQSYICVKVDNDSVIAESNEDNNLTATINLIVLSGIDLTVTSVPSSVDPVNVGSSVSIPVTIKNAGTATAYNVDTGLYLSSNGGASWTRYGGFNTQTLAGSVSDSDTIIFTAPASGTYKVKIVTDENSATPEDDETNNESQIASNLVVNDTIDLTIVVDDSSAIGVSFGDPVSVPVTISNSGTAAAGSFAGDLYMSSDSGAWAGAVSVDQVSITTVASGDSVEKTFSFFANMQPGTYYLRATADSLSSVSETNENNNNTAVITLVVGASVDLVIDTVPETAETYLGGPANVSVTIGNVGSNPATPSGASTFVTSLYLSQSKYVDWNSLTPVATFELASLGGGATEQQVMSFEHDLLVGSYYLRVKVDTDAVVEEGDENNNWSDTFDLDVALAYSGGIGIEAEPYVISNTTDLSTLSFRSDDWDKHFILTADLNMEGIDFAPIGTDWQTPFTGSFVGGNHIISNLVIISQGYGGMFGQIDPGVVVSGIGLDNVLVLSGDMTGALAGWSFGAISECYAQGVVVGGDNTGGLIGGIGAGATVTDCYSTCEVAGQDNVAGLVGSASDATITNCYAASPITASAVAGGLVASASNLTTVASFWDTQVSEMPASAAGEGKSTVEMGEDALYTAWDLSGIWLKLPGVYPIMTWQSYGYGGGSGTELDPYQISNGAQFVVMGSIEADWDKYFILTDDIDFNNWSLDQFQPIGNGTTPFTGVFDGNKKKLVNISVNGIGGPMLALFAVNAGMIQELIIDQIAIDTSADMAGFVGVNMGVISKCYATGSMATSGNQVGAFAAINAGLIENCYSMVDVSVYNSTAGFEEISVKGVVVGYVGLLAGQNTGGAIVNCYANAILSASTLNAGALTGFNDSAAAIVNCYWNSDLTAMANAAGSGSVGTIIASGESNAQMMQQATFVGWDFDEIWTMTENFDYPRLVGIGIQPVLVPDLTVSATPATILAYTDAAKSVSIVVSNEDLGVAQASVAAMYISSADSGWDALDDSAIIGNTVNVGSLAAGASQNDQISFNAPAEPGVYYLKIKADKAAVIDEMSETNNWSSTITLTVAADTDLTATYEGSDLNNYANHGVNAGIKVNNTGTYPAGAFTASLYISITDSGWDSLDSDSIIGSFNVSSLAGMADTTDSVNFNAPPMPGTFYLKFKIDSGNTVAEKSETNNWSETINLTVDPQFDLWSDMVSEDQIAYADDQMTVDVQINNDGNGATDNAFTTLVYISSNNIDWDTLGSGDVVASFETSSLASGADITKTLELTVPSVAGIYYLRAYVDSDDDVDEYNGETNNWSDVIILTVKYGFGGGSGTELDPYMVFTTDDLVKVAGATMQRADSYILMNNLDMTGVGMTPIGMDWSDDFSGTFDGQYHVITALTIDTGGAGYAGLFGQIAASGKVMNLGLENVNVDTDGDFAGAFAGWNNGTIESCYATGAVDGVNKVGGICGGMSGDGATIYQVYSSCSVSGMDECAGIAGHVEQNGLEVVTLSQVYSNGAVLDFNIAIPDYLIDPVIADPPPVPEIAFGGLVAWIGGTVTSEGCFWDTDTSGQSTSELGTGLGSGAMITMSSYTSANWDFIDDGIGASDDWYLPAGGYPELSWAVFTGGNGSEASPFVLETVEDIETLAASDDLWGKNFALGKDINISTYSGMPIGLSAPFTGVLDGNGYSLSGYTLTVSNPVDSAALFAELATGGEIVNLSLKNVNVSVVDVNQGAAALVGVNNGLVANCYVDGVVFTSGDGNNTGALVGLNLGNIETSCSQASIVSSGDIEAIGLIAGYNKSVIEDCYGDGQISADGSVCIAGMIVGINDGTINNCYSVGIAGNINGDSVAGSLIGVNFDTATVSGCYYDSDLTAVGIGAGGSTGYSGLDTAAMKLEPSYTGWDFNTTWMVISGQYPTFMWQGLTCDTDGDIDVDADDLAVFMEQWLSSGADLEADFNGDGKVDLQDYSMISDQWLAGVSVD